MEKALDAVFLGQLKIYRGDGLLLCGGDEVGEFAAYNMNAAEGVGHVGVSRFGTDFLTAFVVPPTAEVHGLVKQEIAGGLALPHRQGGQTFVFNMFVYQLVQVKVRQDVHIVKQNMLTVFKIFCGKFQSSSSVTQIVSLVRNLYFSIIGVIFQILND